MTNPLIDDHVALRLVEAPQQAYAPPGAEAPPALGTASRAVPLLWLGLFDYEEAEVRPSGKLQIFAATTPVAKAKQRAERLGETLPESPAVLREMARILREALEQAPRDRHLALFPEGVFCALQPGAARPYLELLFDLCSLWQRLRAGGPWEQAQKELDRLVPDLSQVLIEQDPRRAGYYLGGSLAEQLGSLERYRLREGQGEKDLEPEALVVGEAGLLLGRFDGTWKLMTSRTTHDLHAVWGEGGVAFIVGRSGTVLRLKKGRCTLEEIQSKTHLHGIWGLNARFVCAVGEEGLLMAYDGRRWQPLSLPTQSGLRAIAGSGPDNICVAAQEPWLLRFDGHSWNRTALPEEAMVNALCAVNGTLLAAGGSRRGGVIYRLERAGWTPLPGTPPSDWLEGLWQGWGEEIGAVASSGPALVRAPTGWLCESLPAERVTAVAGGAEVMAIGTSGRYEVILRRSEGTWVVECALRGLQLKGIWVDGQPKPPRRQPDEAQPGSERHA